MTHDARPEPSLVVPAAGGALTGVGEMREFRGDAFFLSNFYPVGNLLVPIREADGSVARVRAATLEHAFQACKALDPVQRRWVLEASSPGEARARGKRVRLREGWDTLRLDVMRELLARKFADPTLRARLLATGDVALVEGNYHNDTFFGVDLRSGVGENHLGRLLMALRTALRAADA